MENVTQDRLNELVSWLVDTAKSTETFVLEQAPDVARQMVAWGLWGSIAYILMGLGVVAALLGVAACGYRHHEGLKAKYEAAVAACDRRARYSDTIFIDATKGEVVCKPDDCWCLSYILPSIAAFIILVPTLLANVPTIVKCTVAPKVYLIEQAAKLVK